MNHFDLEEFKKNTLRKIVTRNGNHVRIICTDAKRNYPIIGLVEMDGREEICSFMPDGRWCKTVEISDYDLFFVPEKKHGFVSIYRNVRGNLFFGNIRCTEQEALDELYDDKDTRIDTIQVEWEE